MGASGLLLRFAGLVLVTICIGAGFSSGVYADDETPAETTPAIENFRSAAEPESPASNPLDENLAMNRAIATFGDFFDTLLGDSPEQQGREAKVVEKRGDGTLLVDEGGPNGARILDSTDPTSANSVRDFDSTLIKTGAGIEVANGSSGITLPVKPAGRIELGETGISLETTDVAEAASDVRLMSVDGKSDSQSKLAFYANVDTDTDAMVAAVPGGIETFSILRSADSPETIGMALGLTDGQTLVEDGLGGAAVLGSDGETELNVTAPFAIDADGDSVPVTLEIDGDELRLMVPHRQDEYAYPIMVDPIFEWWDWYNGEHTDFGGWAASQVGTTQYETTTYCNSSLTDSCNSGGTGLGRGLYVNALPSRTFPANSQGRWIYTVPGSDSYLESATVSSWRYFKGGMASTHPFGFFGLSTGSAWTNLFWTDVGGGGSGTTLAGGTTSKQFQTGLSSHVAVTTPSGAANARYMRVAAVDLALADQTNPVFYTFDTSAVPSGWSSSKATVDLPFSAWDMGLGVRSAVARTTGQTGGTYRAEWELPCSGTASSPCPTAINAVSHPGNDRIKLDLSKVGDGVSTVKANIFDALGKSAVERNFTVKLDRDQPTVRLTGSLVARREKTVGSAVHHLNVESLDGTSSEPRSGVKSIEITVDNAPDTAISTQACPAGSCPLSRSFSIDPTTLSAGEHTVRINVEDQIGNIAYSQLKFTVDSTDPCRDHAVTPVAGCDEVEGDVYVVTEFEGSPSYAGDLISTQFIQPSTGFARTILPDDTVTTKGLVSCATGLCGEIRTSKPSDEGSWYDYSVQSSSTSDLTQIDVVGSALRPFFEPKGSLLTDVPILDVTKGWQTLPKGHSNRADVYFLAGTTPQHAGDTWWLDRATGLPIRFMTTVMDEGEWVGLSRYFSYSSGWKASELPSDTFVQPVPSSVVDPTSQTATEWNNPEDPEIYTGVGP